MPDGRELVPGEWNRVHIQVEDLAAEVNRLRFATTLFLARLALRSPSTIRLAPRRVVTYL